MPKDLNLINKAAHHLFLERRGQGTSGIVTLTLDGDFVGRVGFYFHPDNMDVTIGESERIFYVSKKYQKRGFGEELGRRVIYEAKRSIKSPPSSLIFFSFESKKDNIGMAIIAEKLGFWEYKSDDYLSDLLYLKPFNNKRT